VFRCDRGDYLVCHTTLCTRGCGCSGHPAFPTPSRGREINARLGRFTPRDRGVVSGLHVIARSEATKQSSFLLRGAMDCFASLAMTALQQIFFGSLKIESVAKCERATSPGVSPATGSAHRAARWQAPAGDPVFRGVSDGITKLRRTGYSAFAEYDGFLRSSRASHPNSTPACCRGCRAKMSARRSRTVRRFRSPFDNARS